MADWQSFTIQVPGKDFLEPARNILETLLVYLEILKALLETIKAFLTDFGNPIKALVEALLALIEELLNALRVSGFFGYFDIPDPLTDPNFDRFFGGTSAFTSRFKQSLYDSKDFNRPQPRQGSTKSGFILLVVENESVFGLLRLIKQLLRFFGKDFSSPRYEAPNNFKALPVGDSGDPILAVASIFSSNIEAIQLSWTLPTSMETPDPGFSDLVTKMAAEFIPPSFLIERADVAPTRPLDVSSGNEFSPVSLASMKDPDLAGPVTYDLTTEFTQQGQPGKRLKVKSLLKDDHEEPLIKFNRYTVISGVEIESILGQLGKFRYIDSDVEIGKTYYYRVRPYSGDLDVPNEGTDSSYINWAQAVPAGRNPEAAGFSMIWPSKSSDDPVIMGKPTAILSVTIPKTIPDFDVIEELRRLFQLAFSLDFHIPLDPEAQFDDNGDPINDTSPIQIGRSSITHIASSLAAFQAFPIVGALASLEAAGKSIQEKNEVTGEALDMPWQTFTVKRQSSRLALTFAQAMLEAGENALVDFRTIMQGSFPAGVPDAEFLDPTKTPNLENMVFYLTAVDDDGHVDQNGFQRYLDAYTDAVVRKNVLAAIRYILNFGGTGVPPDWISIQPLRDIIPWSGQLIYDLLDAIRKLLAAFQGVIDELKAFIDLLIRKIDAMERFIEFLIQLLNFIDSLQVGAYVLNASGIQGNVNEWVSIVDNAGNPPPDRPGGYSAGIALGYVAIDVTAFQKAFDIIF